jgi:hypothetical protein
MVLDRASDRRYNVGLDANDMVTSQLTTITPVTYAVILVRLLPPCSVCFRILYLNYHFMRTKGKHLE